MSNSEQYQNGFLAGFKIFLALEGYQDIRYIDNKNYVATARYLTNWAIIKGTIGDRAGFDDRWDYTTYEDAKEFIDKWDGQGDPEGWHRNMKTGRRRKNGDPATETIRF